MSGWTERQEGNVKIKHYSTSSSIQLTVTAEEETSQGNYEIVKSYFWFDYKTFEDLKKVINRT